VENRVKLTFENDVVKYYDHAIFALYANNKLVANLFNPEHFNLQYQVCEVALGEIQGWQNLGVTVMDGEFWSVMPFGKTELHSLTSVAHTPIIKADNERLSCQVLHGECGKLSIANCGHCVHRPTSRLQEMIESFSKFKPRPEFIYKKSLFTVKAIPKPDSYDTASRPTTIAKSVHGNSHLIFSGKIGSSMTAAKKIIEDIEGGSRV
jgi:hypothetical protein